jgi:hypothetical protein
VPAPAALFAITGVMPEGRRAADGSLDPGVLTLPEVQWAANGSDVAGTCVLTVAQLEAAAETLVLWTDQNVQRGVRPELDPQPPALLPLADGYPDPTQYIFDSENADDMVEKLLAGSRVRLNPLIWNLRPGTFEAYFDSDSHRFHLYRGRVFLPDSHHRHQALLRAISVCRDAPDDYPGFGPESQFTVELYFMSVTDEAEYFFEKNQLGRRADRSRAYELSSQDTLALTAKLFVNITPSLRGNVNRVTDRLTSKNAQIVTLSTLRTMAETFFARDDPPTPTEAEQAATRMSQVYEMLVKVRPELGVLPLARRVEVRQQSLVDQAVMMHGYAALMRGYSLDFEREGRAATARWRRGLGRLSASEPYRLGRWSGDFFARENPLWARLGVLQETKSGRLAVSNTRQTRDVVARTLQERIADAGTQRPRR